MTESCERPYVGEYVSVNSTTGNLAVSSSTAYPTLYVCLMVTTTSGKTAHRAIKVTVCNRHEPFQRIVVNYPSLNTLHRMREHEWSLFIPKLSQECVADSYSISSEFPSFIKFNQTSGILEVDSRLANKQERSVTAIWSAYISGGLYGTVEIQFNF
jgi:hypothetical protein